MMEMEGSDECFYSLVSSDTNYSKSSPQSNKAKNNGNQIVPEVAALSDGDHSRFESTSLWLQDFLKRSQ